MHAIIITWISNMFAGQRNAGLSPVLSQSGGEAEDQGTLRDPRASAAAAAASSAASAAPHHARAATAAHGTGRRNPDAEGTHHEPGMRCVVCSQRKICSLH